MWNLIKRSFLEATQLTNESEFLNDSFLTDSVAANVFYDMHKNDLIYSRVSKSWFSLNKFGIIKNVPDPNSTLGKMIQSDLVEWTQKVLDRIPKFDEEDDDKKKKKGDETPEDKKIKTCNKTILALKQTDKKLGIIKGCTMSDFAIDNLEYDMDTNPYIIAFENGVYDLRTHEHRIGTVSDKCSLTTKYNYIPFEEFSEEQLKNFNTIEQAVLNNFYL